MIYPFLKLNNGTEIVHSEMYEDGRVLVHVETPDENLCFKHADCWMPKYKWEDIYGYSKEEITNLEEIIKSTAHLIMQFSQEGGFDNASGF